MKRKERIGSFRLHVIRGRQGTDRRLRSFRAEPFSEQIHKLVSHEDVNFTDKNGWQFLTKNRSSRERRSAFPTQKHLYPLHAIATQYRGGEGYGEGDLSALIFQLLHLLCGQVAELSDREVPELDRPE